MLTKTDFEREFPEPPQCEVNQKDCVFDVTAVCHHCGRPMCEACSIGIRHQPQLIKYNYTNERGQKERFQQHCPECLANHRLNTNLIAVGGSSLILGLLLLSIGGNTSALILLLSLLLLAGGGFVLWKEYKLKNPRNQNYSLIDMIP